MEDKEKNNNTALVIFVTIIIILSIISMFGYFESMEVLRPLV